MTNYGDRSVMVWTDLEEMTALDSTHPTGRLLVEFNPPTLWVYTTTGWVALASASGGQTAPTPASESGQGVVELATEAEVQAGTGGVLVATVARLKAELDRKTPAATETAQGLLELATTAEAQAGTLTGTYAMNPARVRESIQPEAWIAPTLLASWVNFGAPHEVAGYRKTRTGEVQLKGTIKNGTMTTGTIIMILPVGYRPANTRKFVALQGGNAACRIDVTSAGEVQIAGVTDNGVLSLESVRFDAA